MYERMNSWSMLDELWLGKIKVVVGSVRSPMSKPFMRPSMICDQLSIMWRYDRMVRVLVGLMGVVTCRGSVFGAASTSTMGRTTAYAAGVCEGAVLESAGTSAGEAETVL